MDRNCPKCGYEFKAFAANADQLPPLAPILCEGCLGISIWQEGAIRLASDRELVEIKKSPAYKRVFVPVIRAITDQRRREKAGSN